MAAPLAPAYWMFPRHLLPACRGRGVVADMEYAVLGRTDLRVSRAGFGGGGIGQVWGATTEEESVRTVHRALDLGINFFDASRQWT